MHKLPKPWPRQPLDQLLVTMESGSRPKGGVGELADGIPSLGGEHINRAGGISWETPKHITRNFYAGMKRGRIQRGDILVVKDGATTGKTTVVRNDFPFPEAAINEHVFLLRTDRAKALPEFVGYFLFGPVGQQQILSTFRGAAIGGIAQDFARNVHVPLPPISAQERIIKLLDEADALRKLRADADQRMLSLVPALYNEMFGITNLSTKSWPTRKVGDVVRLINGRAFKPSEWGTKGPPIIRIQNLKESRAAFNHFDGDVEPKHIVSPGALLISWAGQLVSFGVHIWMGPSGVLNQHIFKVEPKEEFEISFLQYTLGGIVEGAKGQFQGSEMKHLTKGTLENAILSVPPLSLQKEFAARVAEIRAMEAQQAASRRRLDDLFQSLLHRAFSGEL